MGKYNVTVVRTSRSMKTIEVEAPSLEEAESNAIKILDGDCSFSELYDDTYSIHGSHIVPENEITLTISEKDYKALCNGEYYVPKDENKYITGGTYRFKTESGNVVFAKCFQYHPYTFVRIT